MSKLNILLLTILITAVSASAIPLGINGLTVGVGLGGLTDGYLAAEYDFEISKYVCIGPKFSLGFGDGMAIYAGGAGRLYIIPDDHKVFQPQLSFGAGFGHRFDDDDTFADEALTGVYFVAAPGCDFDIPGSPISPYIDVGGLFFFGEESDAAFIAEFGIRIDL